MDFKVVGLTSKTLKIIPQTLICPEILKKVNYLKSFDQF